MTNLSAILKNSNKPFLLMGIVNVTPDSFYDGGKHSTFEKAVAHSEKLQNQGVDILDFGGASSRPGAMDISLEEEIRRIAPVIEVVAKKFKGPISVDTARVAVAKAAFDAGATWVNDISAGRFDSKMAEFVAGKKCPVVLQHSRKTPETMQQAPYYNDVVLEVKNELLQAVQSFITAGVEPRNIIVDPGIGFAKTSEHNVTLLHGLRSIVDLGYPVLIGTSRKNFIGKITEKEAGGRLCGSLGSVASAYIRGARIFRVHDVEETGDFLKVLSVIEELLPIDYYTSTDSGVVSKCKSA